MIEEDFLDKNHPDGEIVSSLQYIEYLDTYVPDKPPLYLGMPMLDKFMGGAVPGELWVLSGPSKHGKSTFMRTIIKEYFKQNHLSAVFSFEESEKEFFKKYEGFEKELLFYLPRVKYAFDVDKTFEQAQEAIDKYGIEVLFIDSGQKMVRDLQDSKSTQAVAADFSARLKEFTRTRDLVTWLVWHIKKENVSLKELNYSLLRDTGRLYNELDGLIFMYREEKSEGLTKTQENWLKITATRRSGVWDEMVPIVKRGPYFKELEVEDV